MIRHLTLFALLAFTTAIRAETMQHHGTTFYVYRVDPSKDQVQLLLGDPAGKPNTFAKVRERLEKNGQRLKFAMNSGIFEGNFFPTGLHISEGKIITKLNLETFKKDNEHQWTPNFFLKPNGVFFIRPDGTAGVLESLTYSQSGETPRLATQSGPLLVQDGRIHPVLTPDSESKRTRNGVGVDRDGRIIFASSVDRHPEGESNLYRFAEFFRDRLNCPNALYLDGDISYIYIRGETGPIEETNWFAGILAITEPSP